MARRGVGYVRLRRRASKFGLSAAKEDFCLIAAYCDRVGMTLVAVLIDDDDSGHLEFSERPAGQLLTHVCNDTGARNVVALRLWSLFKDTVDAGRHVRSWRSRRIKVHLTNLAGNPFVNEGEAGQGFNVALEEGATLLRLGTAIFGPRS